MALLKLPAVGHEQSSSMPQLGNLLSCEAIPGPGGDEIRQQILLKVHFYAHVRMASELESYLHYWNRCYSCSAGRLS